MAEALRAGSSSTLSVPNGSAGPDNSASDADDDDDDDYWAQYDNSPAPGAPPTPPPPPRPTSDADHYAQYAHVQPALDNDDPSDPPSALPDPSLNGHTLNGHTPMPPPLDHPHPASDPAPAATLARLEDSAGVQSVAEVAIRQHISTSVKSLFRLARGSGLERDEFERLVRTELEVVGMMGEGD